MALPLAAGAARLISMMTKGALRQTKDFRHLQVKVEK